VLHTAYPKYAAVPLGSQPTFLKYLKTEKPGSTRPGRPVRRGSCSGVQISAYPTAHCRRPPSSAPSPASPGSVQPQGQASLAWIMANRAKKAPHRPKGAQSDHLIEKTAETIAKQHGVAEKTVRRAGKDAEFVDALPAGERRARADPRHDRARRCPVPAVERGTVAGSSGAFIRMAGLWPALPPGRCVPIWRGSRGPGPGWKRQGRPVVCHQPRSASGVTPDTMSGVTFFPCVYPPPFAFGMSASIWPARRPRQYPRFR